MTIDNIIRTSKQGPFQPNWESLKQYVIPDWYQDAKFGIFIHWGVYSVPAFGSEWYPRNMYRKGSAEFEHHVKTYGPQAEFGYKDFVPMFRAELFDPDAWAALFVESGAKYIVPVAEHHDGFAMYDTDLSEWCAAKKGPMRDVIGDLASAVRHRGLVFAASSHRAEHWWFMDGGLEFPCDVQDPAYAGLYGPPHPGPSDHGSQTECPPSEEYLQNWLARTCEIVDKYRPQIIYFDWWIQQEAFEPYLQLFAAYYYNRAAEWGVGVAIDYKHSAFPEGAAVFDVERGQLAGIRQLFWQTDTAVAKNSWGYVEGLDYKTPGDIIGDLVDIVSKNGGLLLNIGPKPDGTIPGQDQEILREIGRWLNVNGEAIYGTRPWNIFGEGPTQIAEGMFTDTNRAAFTGEDIRFTTQSDALYAVALAWPGNTLNVKSLGTDAGLYTGKIGEIKLLGNDQPLKWTQDSDALRVDMPSTQIGSHVFAFKITKLSPDDH